MTSSIDGHFRFSLWLAYLFPSTFPDSTCQIKIHLCYPKPNWGSGPYSHFPKFLHVGRLLYFIFLLPHYDSVFPLSPVPSLTQSKKSCLCCFSAQPFALLSVFIFNQSQLGEGCLSSVRIPFWLVKISQSIRTNQQHIQPTNQPTKNRIAKTVKNYWSYYHPQL